MNEQQLFHWLFIVIFVTTFAISGYYRRKARQSGVIRRTEEGQLLMGLRVLFAAPLYLSFLTYLINPNWMVWSTLDLPDWLRWLAALVGLGMLPVVYWVMRSIGNNVSETFLTKEQHSLVTHGPYHWVRHPLYSVATVVLVALSIVAANWFMLLMAVLQIIVLALAVIPREEAQLILKFGDAYRAYMKRTGRLIPHLDVLFAFGEARV
jgi:protein-S-isoprenylcysteine O-methyltransferase Ste14